MLVATDEGELYVFITERLRRRRSGRSGPSWYADETYLKVKGRWCYLYRALDADGNVDFEVQLAQASAGGEFISATATGPDGTSEFSAALEIANATPAADDQTFDVDENQIAVYRYNPEADQWVEHLHFRGLTFSDTDWSLPEDGYPDCGDVGDIVEPSAITFRAARHCTFADNEDIAARWLESGVRFVGISYGTRMLFDRASEIVRALENSVGP